MSEKNVGEWSVATCGADEVAGEVSSRTAASSVSVTESTVKDRAVRRRPTLVAHRTYITTPNSSPGRAGLRALVKSGPHCPQLRRVTPSKHTSPCSSARGVPWYENMTSSVKPEVHNVPQRRQRRTEPRPQAKCT